MLFARVPALAPSSLSGVHAWPVVVPDALALAQVLRLAEAHIKHEKEELKSLGVVLDRNSDQAGKRGNYVLPSGQLGDLLVTKMQQKYIENHLFLQQIH